MRTCTIIAITTIAILATPSLASGQRRDDGLDLARIAAHEAGLDASADEVAAIAAVARSRCRGCSLSTALRHYSPRFFAGTVARAHYLDLDRSLRRPASWPRRGRRRFDPVALARLLEVADRVAAGELDHRCAEPPDHWGGRVDRARARRLGMRAIDCGETRNDFYRAR